MNDLEWDESNAFQRLKIPHENIDIRFLQDMTGEFCSAKKVSEWGRVRTCIRLPDHTGRHLAADYLCRYPVAVWR